MNWKVDLYDKAAKAGLQQTKLGDVITKKWSLEDNADWKAQSINTTPRRNRHWGFVADMYNYTSQEKGTLVVDFTTKSVRGRCFSGGFTHEEQRVTQSSDLAARLLKKQEIVNTGEACSFEGVYFDLWWGRVEVAKRRDFYAVNAVEIGTEALTILVINAPKKRNHVWTRTGYISEGIEELAQRLSYIFQVGRKLQIPKFSVD